MSHELFTIGHSTHTIERLVELLKQHAISAVGDVRSSPYSRYNPQFNREPLRDCLKAADIAYVFLGDELGARRDDPACYADGRVQFDLVAQTPLFREGLERLRKGIASHRVCLLCAEKDPIACHRTILVCRHAQSQDIAVRHILEDGTLEDHADAERRMMQTLKIPETDLFASHEELLAKAYNMQGNKIAFEEKSGADAPPESTIQ
jgi:uncharacterized protein (DUF488 family)